MYDTRAVGQALCWRSVLSPVQKVAEALHSKTSQICDIIKWAQSGAYRLALQLRTPSALYIDIPLFRVF